MIATGADHLLDEADDLAGRRYGLLGHAASVVRGCRPLHLALASSAAGRPAALFGPEHGYYGVEQDMVAAADQRDPWTGAPIVSLYGDSECSLRPCPQAFAGLDLLIIDLQDVGSRYYTYAATAVWAAEAAMAAGLEIWILDRPNPLGGEIIEGNLIGDEFHSFVGAFRLPVRHGLTLGELVQLVANRRGWDTSAVDIWTMTGWQRHMLWPDTGLPWIAPSPNMPTATTALIYPGGCLIEATELSEGRGTTRPFHLIGAPGIEPLRLAEQLQARALAGVSFLPTYFRPQFQKHRGELCGGIEIFVEDPSTFAPYRCGVELVAVLYREFPEVFAWRHAPYEFVSDRPAIDLLAGGNELRQTLAAGADLGDWIASWRDDQQAFAEERGAALLY